MENNKRSEVAVVAHVGVSMTTTIDRLQHQFKEQGLDVVIIEDISGIIRRSEPMPIKPRLELPIIEHALEVKPIQAWKQHQSGRGKRKYYHR